MESIRIPVLVQTRAQKGELPLVQATRKRKFNPSLNKKGKVDAVATKQRHSPLSSWIGKQLLIRAEDSQEVLGLGGQLADDAGISARIAGYSLRWILWTEDRGSC